MLRRKPFLLAGCFAAAAAVLVLLLLSVDVAPIAAGDTNVGLSGLNRSIHEAVGVDMGMFRLSEILGYLSFGIAFVFLVLGALQTFRRKSLLRVDREILALGGLYLIGFVLYVLFDKVVVNCRPILLPGQTEPEPSFPSTHTMMSLLIFGSAILVVGRYLRNEKLCLALRILLWVLLVATVAARLISGVHWFTDILGGVLISCLLLSLFCAALRGGSGADAEKKY
jgi:undecaprenyl-diphosphatase